MKILKEKKAGYILIVVVLAVPVLFFGLKFITNFMDFSQSEFIKSRGSPIKKCAKEIAEAISEKWNPGVSLSRQRKSILKIADYIYNIHPAILRSLVTNAAVGLEHTAGKQLGSAELGDIINIDYEEIADPYERLVFTLPSDVNPYVASYRLADLCTSDFGLSVCFRREADNQCTCAEENFLTGTMPYYSSITSGYPSDSAFCPGSSAIGVCCEVRKSVVPEISGIMQSNFSYSAMTAITPTVIDNSKHLIRRVNDTAASQKVEISIEEGKIKAMVDGESAFAYPAECNVDIILTIPTNAAACNVYNNDTVTPTEGFPLSQQGNQTISNNVKLTPIYQIAQAYRSFLKKNFSATRGVNVGLIPYSGKVSIPPSRSDWTTNIEQFASSRFTTYQNQFQPFAKGAFLYSTKGVKNAKLGNEYSWNTNLTGTPIMFRCGICEDDYNYGSNVIYSGDLLSTSKPALVSIDYEDPAVQEDEVILGPPPIYITNTTAKGTLFLRMNATPCYMGFANFLSMRCEKTCTTYLPNPYYIVELTSNVNKVYEMLDSIFPIYDLNNVSNFIFIPVTWANNLLQPWTSDPEKEESSEFLSHQSKTTPGRKKAVILIVNKPDYFANQELTYLGFNNDFSEIPVTESDKIRFDVDYSDTSKKFADNTQYDGTIQGAKKILKYSTINGSVSKSPISGYYESAGTFKGRLKFPEKGLIKLVVKPSAAFDSAITFYNTNDIGDCKLGGIDGSAANIDSSNFISEISTFVFSGAKGPTASWSEANDSYGKGASSSQGVNFGHNLSKYKIRYSLTNATIKECKIKNQVLRDYIGQYSYSNTSSYKALILSDGTVGNRVSIGTYMPNVSSGNTPETLEAFSKYRDSCISASGYYHNVNGNYAELTNFSSYPAYIAVNGISSGELYVGGHSQSIFNLMNSAGTFETLYTHNINNKYSGPHLVTGYNDCVNLKITANGDSTYVHQYYLVNSAEKNFIKNISDSDVLYNRGVGLQTLENNLSEKIVAGDYIVFQGDAEVHATVEPLQKSTLKFTNVGMEGTTYDVTETRTFYIEVSQISDEKGSDENYYVDFEMSNIALVSAEITNRPYSKVVPTCSLSGITNGTGTAYITTNVKADLNLNVKAAQRQVIFTNTPGNNISNVGTHSITGPTTFIFPSNDFPWVGLDQAGYPVENTVKKVTYSLLNAHITGAILTNQKLAARHHNYPQSNRYNPIRIDDGFNHAEKDVSFYNNRMELRKEASYAEFSTAHNVKSGKVTFYLQRPNGSPSFECRINDEVVSAFPSFSSTHYPLIEEANFSYDIATEARFKVFITGTGTAPWGIMPDGVDIAIDTPLIMNTDNFADQTTGLWSDGSNFYFVGTGDLSVSVSPVPSNIIYKNASATVVTRTIGDECIEWEISPETHLYEQQGDGSYRITLDLNSVEISDPKMVNTDPLFEYLPNRIPSMSRVVDFSKNIGGKPDYNSSLISSLVLKRSQYNNLSGYWENSVASYPYFEVHNANMVGDFFFLIEDIGNIMPNLRFFNRSRGPETFSGVKCEIYDAAGLHRRYQEYPDTRVAGMASIDFPNAHLGGACKYMYAGFTLPVNTALYYGAGDSGLHKYSWQSENGNLITYDPSVAAKQLTIDACAKLKSDNPNARIYVIKYRRQPKHKNITNNTQITSDYSAVDGCASSSAFVYSADTEESLNMYLEEIAFDIKQYAEHKNAKVEIID